MILVTPSRAFSSASISSRPSSGLRLGWSRHCSVVISVPSPSTVIAPPSRIIPERIAGTSRCSSSRPLIRSSASQGWCLRPQALKRKSTPARRPSSSRTKIGAESRNQESSWGISTTVRSGPHRVRASSPWPGGATMVTGSNSAMARATAAYSRFTSSRLSPQRSDRTGQAIRQPSCSVHSAGMRWVMGILVLFGPGRARHVGCAGRPGAAGLVLRDWYCGTGTAEPVLRDRLPPGGRGAPAARLRGEPDGPPGSQRSGGTDGWDWVAQWMPPPPEAMLSMSTWTMSRVGNSAWRIARARASAAPWPNWGTSTAPLAT